MHYILIGTVSAFALPFILPLLPLFSQPPKLRKGAVCGLTAAMFMWGLAQSQAGRPPALDARHLLLGITLTVAAAYDWQERVIPNRLVALSGVSALVLILMSARAEAAYLLLSAVASLLLMTVAGIAARGALGAGDVKLIAVASLMIGFRGAMLITMLGFIVTALPAVYLLLSGKGLRHKMPFAPFLWLAGLIVEILALA